MLTRVLVPLEERSSLSAVIPPLRTLVGGTGALVHLLAVRPPVRAPRPPRTDYPPFLEELLIPGVPGMALQPVARTPGPSLDSLRARAQATWLELLRREGSALAYDGIVVQREVRFGDPFVETLAAVQRHALHLIVLAAEPRGWLRRLVSPSLAEMLQAHADVPVMVVPPARRFRRGVVPGYDRVPV